MVEIIVETQCFSGYLGNFDVAQEAKFVGKLDLRRQTIVFALDIAGTKLILMEAVKRGTLITGNAKSYQPSPSLCYVSRQICPFFIISGLFNNFLANIQTDPNEYSIKISGNNLQEDPIFGKLQTIFDKNFEFELSAKNEELLVLLKPSTTSEVGLHLNTRSLLVDFVSYHFDMFGSINVVFHVDNDLTGVGGIEVMLQDNKKRFENCFNCLLQ